MAAHTDEPTNTLNIKRGILSTLQVDQNNMEEIDVNGVCKSTVEQKDENTVVETKKLSDCIERAQNEYGIQAASIKTPSAVKPLDSDSKCTFTMNKDMIKSVVCEEQHIFKPFSAGYESPSGAITFVEQTMKFVAFKTPSPSKLRASGKHFILTTFFKINIRQSLFANSQ